MKVVTISEAKNRLSALLAQVKTGVSILIVDRGRPVARLEPAIGGDGGDDEGRLARLERAGVLRRAKRPLPSDFFDRELPRLKGDISIVDVLLEERRQGW